MEKACEMPAFDNVPTEIEEILTLTKTIAVVGLSPKEDRDSNRVAQYLQSHGYKIIPVNPMHEEILGEKSHPNLIEIDEDIDVVDIFRKPEAVPEIVDEAIKSGAKVIWMQEGIVNNVAAQKALDANLKVVMNRCMMKEHKKLSKKRIED